MPTKNQIEVALILLVAFLAGWAFVMMF